MSRHSNDGYNRNRNKDDEIDEFLIFGYSCKLFPNSSKAETIHEERHMVPLDGDGSTKVDRYDCRLLLSSVHDAARKLSNADGDSCPTEAMEEDMCEEERYKDMYKDIQGKAAREEERKRRESVRKRNEVGFNYGAPLPATKPENRQSDSDSEDEPFEPPSGIKLPTGLVTPENQKLNHIIEKTASFVVANGPQMEIVIKAKQRENYEQFGFMDFDHKLNPYYKYIQKLIREKKYVPVFEKKEKKVSQKADKKSLPSALAAIAQEHSSDSDDSDCELHPSLLVAMGKRSPSPDVRDKAGIGPEKKVEPPSPMSQNVKFAPTTSGMYAELFKNLHEVNCEARGEPVGEEPLPYETEGRVDDQEYREWYESFYSQKCPWSGPKPMVPPPPDIESVVNKYADFVANNGPECEAAMSSRTDLHLDFMRPESVYFSYYHHKVRLAHWKLQQLEDGLVRQAKETAKMISRQIMRQCSPSPPALANQISVGTPPPPPSPLVQGPLVAYTEADGSPPMNRRQRRLAMGLKATNIPPPGVADIPQPGLVDLSKMHPVSFTLSKKVDDLKVSSVLAEDPSEFDPEVELNEKTDENEKEDSEKPPTVLSHTQIDRKEKARIFMEKIMEEKRLKQKEEEEEMKKRKFVEDPKENQGHNKDSEKEKKKKDKKSKKDRKRSRSRSSDEDRRRRKRKHRKRSRSSSRTRSRSRRRSRDRSDDRRRSRSR